VNPDKEDKRMTPREVSKAVGTILILVAKEDINASY